MSLQVDTACLARQLVGSDDSILNPPNGGNPDSESNLERLIVDNATQAGRLCLYGAKETLDAAAGETVIPYFAGVLERSGESLSPGTRRLETSRPGLNQGERDTIRFLPESRHENKKPPKLFGEACLSGKNSLPRDPHGLPSA